MKQEDDHLISTKLFHKFPVEEIKEICFLDSLTKAPKDVEDLSEAQDGSVLGWMENGTLSIAGDGGVIANKNSSYLFYKCINLEHIYFNDRFHTQNVTDMHSMFWHCSSLRNLDVSGFDTRNVTDMHWMFKGCSSLRNIDVSSFDTRNVTDMGGMFKGCSSLRNIDVSGFDTRNVTYMGFMFDGCSSLIVQPHILKLKSNEIPAKNTFPPPKSTNRQQKMKTKRKKTNLAVYAIPILALLCFIFRDYFPVDMLPNRTHVVSETIASSSESAFDETPEAIRQSAETLSAFDETTEDIHQSAEALSTFGETTENIRQSAETLEPLPAGFYVQVPLLIGLEWEKAISLLKETRLEYNVWRSVENDSIETDSYFIINQSIPFGSLVLPQTLVSLEIGPYTPDVPSSSDSPLIAVPSLIGLAQTEAESILTESGFEVLSFWHGETKHEPYSECIVIDQSIPGDSLVPYGTLIELELCTEGN